MNKNEDIFDEIARFVPVERRAPYWRAVSKLRCLPADDEVVLLVQVMGIHTFVLRDLPTALLQEREALVRHLKENHDEFSRLASVAKDQTIEAVNETERVAVDLINIQETMRSLVKNLQEVGILAANNVDVDTLSQRLTAELEEHTIKPHAKLVEQSLQSIERLDIATTSAQRAVDVWKKMQLRGVWMTAFVVAFCVCGLVLFVGWRVMEAQYATALDRQVAYLTRNVTRNKEALTTLGLSDIMLKVGRAGDEHGPHPTQRMLVIQPAMDVRMDQTSDGEDIALILIETAQMPTLRAQPVTSP